jgi:hypothetical protein
MEATQLSWQSPSSWQSEMWPRDNHVMAEAQGHAGYQFSRLSDEASHSSGLVPVHTRPGGIPSGVCPKVLATESTSAHNAQ